MWFHVFGEEKNSLICFAHGCYLAPFQLLYDCPNMQNSEKLCLKWNDFQENINSAFGSLRNDKEFSDITLVCEDGTQVEAHKVILASSSPFFMEILKRNKHAHPLIYMRGIKAETLDLTIYLCVPRGIVETGLLS